MNKVFLILTFILSTLNFHLTAQDKQPEILPDYYQAVAGFGYTFKPMLNDIVEEGHTARILVVYDSPDSHFTFNDSCIFYTAEISTKGLDSIRYRIKDLQNNLVSETGKIYIRVINDAMDTINVNNVSALINPFGCLFWDYVESNHYEFPKGSGLNTLFSLAMNIAATDINQNPYLSATLYRQFGTDFFPGPVSSGEFYDLAYDTTWTKVWKLSRQEILTHMTSWDQEGYSMPRSIASWPGNGDPGKGQALMMAPYHDRNDNGLYDPANGDYPLIRGDQAIYFIYNDIRAPHTEFGGSGLAAEIHCMVYAFDLPDNPALNNTVFVNYMLTNRSNTTYNNVRLSLFADTDIGAPMDDFTGCDTLLNAALSYNARVPDSSFGEVVYGDHPPAQSVMVLNRKMESYISCGYSPDYQWLDKPHSAVELLNNMNGFWNDGSPVIGNGCGHSSCATGNVVHFAFPGDPGDADAWSMLQSPLGMSDFSCFVNTQPLNQFHPGESVCIDVALTSAMDTIGDHLGSYALLKQYIETVKTFYNANFPASCFDIAPAVDEKLTGEKGRVQVFPNPTDGSFWIQMNPGVAGIHYRLIDLTGRMRISGTTTGSQTMVDIGSSEPGLYILHLFSNEGNTSVKIVKN